MLGMYGKTNNVINVCTSYDMLGMYGKVVRIFQTCHNNNNNTLFTLVHLIYI